MRRIGGWVVLGAFSFLGASGCGRALGANDIIGVWETTSVNGYAVPGTVTVRGRTYEARYFRWTFVQGGVCTVAAQIDGDEDRDAGNYRLDLEEQTITVSLDRWVLNLEGSLARDRMTLTDPAGVAYVLER